MSYLVKEISDKKGMKDFLSLPAEIYKGDPNWVAPQNSEIRRVLNPEKNPYFENASLKLFVCYLDGKPVCRSVLVVNKLHWLKWNKKSAFFGFFESINDSEAVSYLFSKIEEAGKALGAEYLEGPFNPNHYSELGILVDDFSSEPIFFETYNPCYYPLLLEKTGFSELTRFHTRINTNISATLSDSMMDSVPERYMMNFRVRKFNIWRLKKELALIREINNDAFENNWYFLPLSMKEYSFAAKFLFFLTYPGHILIAEYKGKPVGVTQFVLNINSILKPYRGNIKPWDFLLLLFRRRKIKELIIFTAGVKKSAQHTKITALIMHSMVKIMLKYPTVATSWVSDENKSIIHITDLYGMKPHKYFVIYSKALQ